MSASPTIYLVHGTWARKTKWVNDDSPLVQALKQQLVPGASFKRFAWSGRNSHRARRNAAHRLADDIERTLAVDPNTPIFMIGHSHAGNVQLMATARPSVRGKIAGMVCLATPFFQPEANVVEQSLVGEARSKILFWLLFGASIAVAVLVGDLSRMGLMKVWPNAWPWIVNAPLFLFLVASFFVALRLTERDKEYQIARRTLRQSALMDMLQIDRRCETPTLALRVQIDEALVGLRFADRVGRIASYPFNPADILQAAADNKVVEKALWAFPVLLVFFVGLAAVLPPLWPDDSRIGRVLFYLPHAIAMCFVVPLVVLAHPPTRYALKITVRAIGVVIKSLAHGVDPRDALLVDVGTCAAPAWLKNCDQACIHVDKLFLRHCEIYDHPDVVARTVNWIDARCAHGTSFKEI